MILTLEITGPQGARLAAGGKQFTPSGGIIGRDKRSDWVLPHAKVSARHARITCADGVFFVEDSQSSNGTYLNSPKNRLTSGRPYPLKSGDRLLIGPYEISVSVSSSRPEGAYESPGAPFGSGPFDPDDPFAQRSYPPASTPPYPRGSVEALEPAPEDELDPLKLLDPQPPVRPPRKIPTAKELDAGSPWDAHYQPPAIVPPPLPTPAQPVRPAAAPLIPAGYNPLASDDAESVGAVESPVAPLALPASAPDAAPRAREPVAQLQEEPVPLSPAVVLQAHEGLSPAPVPAVQPAVAPGPAHAVDGGAILKEVLVGAGLEGVAVTPELARSFGQILRVVVTGVMDVLEARHQIKDEFRMRVTHFRVADNNPLKFSANVDDALHNLLVKRNQAYLAPVEAFEDAFVDLRHHQVAMLAGMRVAFECMLAEFDPDRLERLFDQQAKKASLIGMPARLRYWDMYRDKQQKMAKDPETTFRELFGEAFAKAYEEQLELLRTKR